MQIDRRCLLRAGSSLLAFAALTQRAQQAAGLAGAASMTGLMALRGHVHAAGTRRILLINPNSNQATTDMMVQIAQSAASNDIEIVGATAPHSPAMIVDPGALAASAPQVVEIGLGLGKDVSGIIISAFGDPGIADLRRQVSVPVVGIAEAAMLQASDKGRRFGVATTTPKLVASIDARAVELGLAQLYTGTRLTSEDPNKLVADPSRLVEALRQAVSACIELDKAEAVIIGGGPLGNAATALTPMFSVPVIAPIPAAVHRLIEILRLVQK
jgi:Asp/Glu/hydantoin racemase